MSLSAYLRRAADLGLTLEQAADLAEAMEAAQKPKRSSAAERQARYRENRNERDVTRDATNDVTDLPLPPETEVFPKPLSRTQTTNPNLVPPISPTKRVSKASLTADFERFWAAYPRKLAKGDAERAFPKALAATDLETLIAAAQAMGRLAEDVKFIPHPSTWLNGKRWLDTTDPPKAGPGATGTVFDEGAIERRKAENRRLYEAAE